uniref:Uncharacterized protein n=1 Tax=Ascaris lumbricoides TaxID=6252 RepID=A0A0M3IE07_ASCLU
MEHKGVALGLAPKLARISGVPEIGTIFWSAGVLSGRGVFATSVMDVLRLQEDDFNDEGGDDLLNDDDVESIYDGDFSFHESEIDQDSAKRSTSEDVNEAQSKILQKQQHFHPSIPIGRLETIHEESRTLSEGIEELERSCCSSRERPQKVNVLKTVSKNDEESVQFVKAGRRLFSFDCDLYKGAQ